jgi:SAM-dependent methyltransferase
VHPVIVGAAKVKNALRSFTIESIQRRRLASYLKSDRRPWRTGYDEYKREYIDSVIKDDSLLKVFREGTPLPYNYAFRLDARAIEIPWVLARAGQLGGRFLDAGSALNCDFVLTSRALANKKLTVVTLAPEGEAHWRLGVSYVFGDLRRMDFRDELFDAIACISTIEHVGMDNSMYAGEADLARRGDPGEFLLAVDELKRVLKPGGVLYITFPFGRYENHGWFQQFDAQLVDVLIEGFDPSLSYETIFRYEPEGWSSSDRATCAQCRYFDVHTSKYFDPNSIIEYPSDYPAGERALACLELHK